VIAKLSSIYPYKGLSLKDITKKLVFFLTLATDHKAQTLSLLRISQIFLDEKLIIRVPDRIKTSASGSFQPFFPFSRFTNHENLCVVHLMEHHIELIRALRPSTCDFLFISFSKSHRAVSS